MLRLVARQRKCLKLDTSTYQLPLHLAKFGMVHLPHVTHKTCLARRAFTSTQPLSADITLTVDGKEVTVPQGTCQVPHTSELAMLIRSYRFCPNTGL